MNCSMDGEDLAPAERVFDSSFEGCPTTGIDLQDLMNTYNEYAATNGFKMRRVGY